MSRAQCGNMFRMTRVGVALSLRPIVTARILARTQAGYLSTTASIQRSLLHRPRLVAALTRILIAPGVGRTLAGGWSIVWNNLRDGATPSVATGLAATAAGLGQLDIEPVLEDQAPAERGQHPRAIADQRRIKKTTTTTIRITTSNPPPMYMICSLVFSTGRPSCSARSSSRTNAHDR